MKFLQTSEFRDLWVAANTQAHEALVAVVEGKSSPLDRLRRQRRHRPLEHRERARGRRSGSPGSTSTTRPSRRRLHQTFVIAKPKSLGRIRRAATTLKRLSIVLPVAALVLAGLALAISRERRRTLFWLGGGLAAGAIAGLVVVAVRAEVLPRQHRRARRPGGRGAGALRHASAQPPLRARARHPRRGARGRAAPRSPAPRALAVGIRSRTLRSAGGMADSAAGAERDGELGRREQGHAAHDHVHLRADLPRHGERSDAPARSSRS